MESLLASLYSLGCNAGTEIYPLHSIASALHLTARRLSAPARDFNGLVSKLRYSNPFIFLARLRRAAITCSVAPLFELRAIRKIRTSGYFDAVWYLRKNPDVAKSHVDPVLHYFATGWREGRDPGPIFSTGGYLARNPDIAAAGMNPLAHFLLCGLLEGRAGGVLMPNVKNRSIDQRFIASAGRYRADSRPVILMLLHQEGGGTEQHALKLAAKLASRARILMLKVGPNFRFILSTLDFEKPEEFPLHDYDVTALSEVLKFFNVQRVHVHHVYGFHDEALVLLSRLGLPYDLTVHDYMLLCPRIFMYRTQTRGYCGEPDEFGCTRCLLQDSSALSIDIVAWRWRGRTLIEGAERVICPTRDCATRILRYAPCANVRVTPHEDPLKFEHRNVRVPALTQDEPMRIVVLGVVAGHKGIEFLLDCVSNWKRIGLLVTVTVIGESLLPDTSEYMQVTGPYEKADLPRLIADADPHLILYPQKCPETYSYTLSEGLMAEVPLLGPDLGSFRERMEGKEWCWLYDSDASQKDFTELISRIRVAHIETKTPPPVIAPQPSQSSYDAPFYEREYLCVDISDPITA